MLELLSLLYVRYLYLTLKLKHETLIRQKRFIYHIQTGLQRLLRKHRILFFIRQINWRYILTSISMVMHIRINLETAKREMRRSSIYLTVVEARDRLARWRCASLLIGCLPSLEKLHTTAVIGVVLGLAWPVALVFPLYDAVPATQLTAIVTLLLDNARFSVLHPRAAELVVSSLDNVPLQLFHITPHVLLQQNSTFLTSVMSRHNCLASSFPLVTGQRTTHFSPQWYEVLV